MNEFEEMLAKALSDRARTATDSTGSVADVRRRARHRSRRNALVGAGAVVVLGTAGVAAVMAGGDGSRPARLSTAGDGVPTGDTSATNVLWRCTGPTGMSVPSVSGTLAPLMPS